MMDGEGRWLRRDPLLFWSVAGRIIAPIGAFPWMLLCSNLWGRHPTSDPKGALLWYLPIGILLPLFLAGVAWSVWVEIRHHGWFVGPKGIEVWSWNGISQTYPWTKIRSVDPWTQDQIRIRLLDTPEEPSLGLQRGEAVLWFREYARGRVAEKPPTTDDWV